VKDAPSMFLMFGLFGVPYVVIVGLVYSVLAVTWKRFETAKIDLFALAVPIGVYLFFELGVAHHQAFNAGYANIDIALVVVATLPYKARRPRGDLRAAWVTAVLGAIAAFVAWQFVAHSDPMPMF
jgi:hypothetical protein